MVLVAGFGLRLRPMLGVLLALLLTGLGTHAIKDGLGLPRPVRVDARVLDKGKTNRQWLTERGGAPSAFGLPSEQAIAAARALHDPTSVSPAATSLPPPPSAPACCWCSRRCGGDAASPWPSRCGRC